MNLYYFLTIVVYRSYVEIAEGENLPLAIWGPVGNGIVFVLNNNVYYREISGRNVTERQLTYDGIDGVLYNGVPDWVYEGASYQLFLIIINSNAHQKY